MGDERILNSAGSPKSKSRLRSRRAYSNSRRMSTDSFAAPARSVAWGLQSLPAKCDNTSSTMSPFVGIVSLKAEGAPARYEQIANALSQAIRSGQLRSGDGLHTLRRLVSELGV